MLDYEYFFILPLNNKTKQKWFKTKIFTQQRHNTLINYIIKNNIRRFNIFNFYHHLVTKYPFENINNMSELKNKRPFIVEPILYVKFMKVDRIDKSIIPEQIKRWMIEYS